MAELQPDQAEFLLNSLLSQLKREYKTTLRVIQAVPVTQGGYKPDPGSMSALDLAWHLGAAEIFFMTGAAAGEFSAGSARPEHVQDSAGIGDWYRDNFARCFEQVRGLTPEQLLKPIPFHGYTQTALEWLQFMLTHSIHHRGQLTVYLRPMGATVPAMHG